MHPSRADRLILVGMMGSGKTTVGRLLAARTGWRYLDNDELLSEATRRSAREIARFGEPELRAAESAALLRGLNAQPPVIVGSAAGAVLDTRNRAAIADAGTVVWLRARPPTLAARAIGATHRPWLEADALAWFERADRERAPLYESIADLVVDVDEVNPTEAVAVILEWLGEARQVARVDGQELV